MDYTKSFATVLSLQSVAANSVLLSSAIDLSSVLGGLLHIQFGRRSATSGTAGVKFRIESSGEESGDGSWVPLFEFATNFAAVEAEAVSGTVGSGTNVITVASTTNLAAGDHIFIDNGTIGNSEWHRIKSIVSNTSVTVENNLANAQTGATMYDDAQSWSVIIPPEVIRLRLAVDGSAFTQAFAVRSFLSKITAIE